MQAIMQAIKCKCGGDAVYQETEKAVDTTFDPATDQPVEDVEHVLIYKCPQCNRIIEIWADEL